MCFVLKDDPERAAFFKRDVRAVPCLVRDETGNHRFAHKSLVRREGITDGYRGAG